MVKFSVFFLYSLPSSEQRNFFLCAFHVGACLSYEFSLVWDMQKKKQKLIKIIQCWAHTGRSLYICYYSHETDWLIMEKYLYFVITICKCTQFHLKLKEGEQNMETGEVGTLQFFFFSPGTYSTRTQHRPAEINK